VTEKSQVSKRDLGHPSKILDLCGEPTRIRRRTYT
jgi:hypothetical protein